MKFGLHLKKKGVITAEQLVAAIDYQHSREPPVGQLAMEEGSLSAQQVFKILRSQSDVPHERFGEVAVSMGMLTPAQLQRLLMIQWQRKPSLIDALVQLQILSQARVEKELSAYRDAMEHRNVVIRRVVPPAPHLGPDVDARVRDESQAVAMMAW